MKGYAVKVQNGAAHVYDIETSSLKRTLGNRVVSAQVLGDCVQVTKSDGRVEVYDIETASLRRSF